MGKICQYYLKGTCKFGDRCYNEHRNPNQQRTFQNENHQRDYHDNRGGGGGGQYGGRNNYNHHGGNQNTGHRDYHDNRGGGGGGQYGGRNNYNHHGGNQNTGHRDSGRNQYQHKSNNRFAALSHQPDPEFNPKSFHPQRTRTTSSSSSNSQQNDHSTLDRIKKDMKEWEESGQWPLSCYAFIANGQCIGGFEDFSPEEIRYNAYEANASGKHQHYLDSLHKLLQSFVQKRLECATMSVESLHQVMAHSKQPSTSNGLFAGVTSSTSIFGSNSSSTSLFGQPTGSNTSTSLFGQPSGTNAPTSLFGDKSPSSPFGSNTSSTSIFGSNAPSTSIFGGNTSSTPHSLFAPPPLPTSSGDPGPFSSSSGTQNENSMLPSSEESKEEKVRQVAAVMKCSEQDMKAFKQATFTLGAIPECPPPPELC